MNSTLLTKDAIKEIICMPNDDFEAFRISAQKRRETHVGNTVYLRASMEIGNNCINKCEYCGMSSVNNNLSRYTMTKSEMLECVDQIVETDIKQLHIVSGENQEPLDTILDVIKYAKKRGLEITTVLGKREKQEYIDLFEAGARRYIMKFETSNSSIFEEAKPGNMLSDRLENIEILKSIGFKIGTGTIIGLPGTNTDDVINDLFLLKKINPHMASSSAFSPNKESAYGKYPAGSKDLTMRFICLMRMILREDIYIPSSSSLGFEGQVNALKHGANVISVHFTPEKYSGNFSMYKSENRISRQMNEIIKIVHCANMKIGEYV